MESPVRPTTPTRSSPPSRPPARPDRCRARQIADKAERERRRGRSRRRHREPASQFADDADAEKQIKSAIRRSPSRSCASASSKKASASTAADPRPAPLSAEVGVLPTAHGSGLFQRGETQVLNVTTLGTKRMDQMIDGIDPDRASATCTTTTSRPSRLARPASCVARSVARSATVRSPSVRFSPSCPDTTLIMRSINSTHRVWRNEAADKCSELETCGADFEELLTVIGGENAKRMYDRGDLGAGIIACGQGIGLCHEILPVKTLFEDMISQATEVYGKLSV